LGELKSMLPIDVLLMAGGEGQRLRPLTEKTPKPMLKLGSKPILEHNINRLKNFGIQNIHISIKYLGEQISNYFGNGKNLDLKINYIRERKPLGTIGAAGKIKKFNHEYLLLMNTDLITNIDLESFYLYAKKHNADIAVASIPYEINVPYAIFETKGPSIKSLKEKPSFTYFSNAGIYLIKNELLKYIPNNKKFHATQLLELAIKKKKKLIYYKVLDYWLDMGSKEDYEKAKKDFKFLNYY